MEIIQALIAYPGMTGATAVLLLGIAGMTGYICWPGVKTFR